MSNTKQIEEDGLKVLRRHLIERLGVSESDIEDTRNKGNTAGKLGCDLVLQHESNEYYIEMKAFSREVPTNIRFTHQTVASFHEEGLLHQLLVALVSNLEAGAECAKVQFFRFGDVSAKDILVEPHFIIQPKRLPQLLHTNVNDLLTSRGKSLELDALLSTQVRGWMRWRKRE
ncbi:MAG TPA: hypothetical protein VMV72_18730 [Verrucomicrobiae bacterium]|nr:hypothetical protein [Verrucomicrobiae bacterium]